MTPIGAVSKTFDISAAHWLPTHAGKCQFLHGHNYRFVVSVEGEFKGELSSKNPFVIDFGDLKKAVNRIIEPWDHALLTHYSPNEVSQLFDDFLRPLECVGIVLPERVIPLGMWTTAENLALIVCRDVGQILRQEGHSNLAKITVECFETPTSVATVSALIPTRSE